MNEPLLPSPSARGTAITSTAGMLSRQRLARRLRLARQRAGLSQLDAAVKADVDLRTVRRLEQGQIWPRLDTLLRLAEAIGTSPEALLSAGEDEATASQADSPPAHCLNAVARWLASLSARGSAAREKTRSDRLHTLPDEIERCPSR